MTSFDTAEKIVEHYELARSVNSVVKSIEIVAEDFGLSVIETAQWLGFSEEWIADKFKPKYDYETFQYCK